MKSMRFLISALFIMTIFLAACGGEDTLAEKQEKLEKLNEKMEKVKGKITDLEEEIAELAPDTTAVKVTPITVLEIEDTLFQHFIHIQGSAQSEKNIEVTTDMGGLITSIPVKEGQKVYKGQTLVNLDNSIVNSQIAEVKTALDLAIITFDKQARLWEQNIGSEIQYLQAKNNKERLESQLSTLYTQSNKSKIKAPVSGIVDEVFVKVGEMASPGRATVRVVNLNKIKVEVDLSEKYLTAIKKGDDVEMHFPALNLTKSAKVKTIGQTINVNNRTFKLVLILDNPDKMIKPNLLSEVKINDYTKEKAIAVPTRLIQENQGEKYVFVACENDEGEMAVEKRIVETGVTYKADTEITEGLNEHDLLIDEGYRDVSMDDRVEIVEDQIQ